MARKIYISSDMSIDERLMSCGSDKAVLMWPWVLLALDDWGRGDASPRRLKAQLFPMLDSLTVDDVAEALSSYSSIGLILLYAVDGKDYMAVPPVKWFRYQTHVKMDKRSNDDASHFPAPPEPAISEEKESVLRNGARLREPARNSALPLTFTTPSPSPSPSPSLPPSTPTPPPGARSRSAGDGVGGLGFLEKSVQILLAEGFSRAEVERAAEDLRLNPPVTPIRSAVSVLRKVAVRLREEVSSAVPPVESEEDARTRAEAKKAEFARRRETAQSRLKADLERGTNGTSGANGATPGAAAG